MIQILPTLELISRQDGEVAWIFRQCQAGPHPINLLQLIFPEC
jgi:hypothetical protein